MELLIIVYKTLFFYVYVLIMFRIMGKREVGQISIQDLAVSILITELVAISIENVEDPLVYTIVPVLVLVLLEIIVSFISIKSNKFRNIMEGKPVLIINRGKICFKEMIKQKITLDNILLSLRENNIKSIDDVEYAILENNGKLTIFKYNFLKLKSDLPLPLVLDGVIQKDTLKYLNKDETWLRKMISKESIDIKNIFYAFYKNGKPYIIKK